MRRRVEIVAFETERVIQHSAITECPVCCLPTELLTPVQAATLIQVELHSIEQWLAEGLSHSLHTPDGQPRICKNSLLRFAVPTFFEPLQIEET